MVADAQLKIKHGWGITELRAEYWFGTANIYMQLALKRPPLLLTEPYYIRDFDGAFFYFLQNIVQYKAPDWIEV